MSGDREDEQPGGQSPEQQRDMVGNRTMQLDAVSDEMFEDLDYPDRDGDDAVAPPPGAAPPPLPRKRGRRWNATAVAALFGVVVVAAVLGLLAANVLFGGDEEVEASASDAAEPAAEEQPPEEEGEPQFVPLELDEVVIESGNTDGDEPVD